MRLNLRLIGILFGILLLGLVGRQLFFFAGRTGSYGGDRRRGDNVIYLVLIGLALMILGFLGSFLGNLIKAAVSRQREFLADASAVQFTRNPDGISGALKRIGSAIFGSRIENPPRRRGQPYVLCERRQRRYCWTARNSSATSGTHPRR